MKLLILAALAVLSSAALARAELTFVAQHLYSRTLIVNTSSYPTEAACKAAKQRIRSRLYKILWKKCVWNAEV